MVGGKRKIPITKRETKAQRAVTFSKRRRGLFNKAAELCMLSGSQVAVLASSPFSDEKMYLFGHNSVDEVFDAFLSKRAPAAVGHEILRKAFSLYNEIKKTEKDPEQAIKSKELQKDEVGFWWDSVDLEKTESIVELQAVVDYLENLKENAVTRMNDLFYSQLSSSGSCTSTAATAADPHGGQDCHLYKFGNNDPDGFALASNCISLHGNFEGVEIINTLKEPDFIFGLNNNLVNAASASNYAFVDENSVISCESNIQKAILKCHGKQDCYENLLAMDGECYNNKAPMYPLIPNNADTTSDNQNLADCLAHNCPQLPIQFFNSSQLQAPMPQDGFFPMMNRYFGINTDEF